MLISRNQIGVCTMSLKAGMRFFKKVQNLMFMLGTYRYILSHLYYEILAKSEFQDGVNTVNVLMAGL